MSTLPPKAGSSQAPVSAPTMDHYLHFPAGRRPESRVPAIRDLLRFRRERSGLAGSIAGCSSVAAIGKLFFPPSALDVENRQA
jgi:hypothetical protein